jgi:hypothetical protein
MGATSACQFSFPLLPHTPRAAARVRLRARDTIAALSMMHCIKSARLG